jgi:hypothetical protein
MLLPLIIAGVAAAAILLIVFGLAGSRSVDPVQARLTQLGSMQAKNLEELELQQPFFSAPCARGGALSGFSASPAPSADQSDRAPAGQAATGDSDLGLPGPRAVAAIVGASIRLPGLRVWPATWRWLRDDRRWRRRLLPPRLLAQPTHQGPPQGGPLAIPDTSTC